MIYRSGQLFVPRHVGANSFSMRWRGLDPEEVYAYLRQIADEMDRLLRDLNTTRAEAERIRQGLRQWQARHASCKFAEADTLPYNGRYW